MLCETGKGTLIPALSGKPNSGTRPGGEDIVILLLLLGSILCSICSLWSVIPLHVGLFMVDYFVESHGGVKRDEQ